MMPISRALLVFALLCLPAGAGAADPVEMRIVTNVVQGQGEVGLTIVANAAVRNAIISLSGPAGRIRRETGPIAEGGRTFIAVAQRAGTVRYTGRLEVEMEDGETGDGPLSFELTVLEPLRIGIENDRIDLDARSLVVTGSRPIARAAWTVFSETGAVLDRGELTASPSARFPIVWGGQPGTVIRIDLTAWDRTEAFAKLVLNPWFVEIRHDEVTFETGSDAILPSEEPKLAAALEAVREKMRLYGDLVEWALYVAGYTDTVGGHDYNQGLSQRRARSIAAWFAVHGFSHPLWYQGFGEEVLAVGTPDQTDEPRNRRAIYFLGGSFTPQSPAVPRTDWIRLR